MKITRFIGLDFVGFKSVVNAIGGVNVCTNGPVIDRQLGTIIGSAGRHTLLGDKALNYVRARKVQGSPRGDYDRIKRQQQFISSAFDKIVSAGTLDDPVRLGALANSAFKAIFVDNVSVDFLLNLGRSMRGAGLGDITFKTYPTTQTLDNGNEGSDSNAAHRMFGHINSETDTVSSAPPSDPKLVVPDEDTPSPSPSMPKRQPVTSAKKPECA